MNFEAQKLVSLLDLPSDSLAALAGSAFGPFETELLADLPTAQSRLAQGGVDALLMSAGVAFEAPDFAMLVAHDIAVLVVTDDLSVDSVLACLQFGAQDVLSHAELHPDTLARRVRAAIERQCREREARVAYATDLSTGLPHQQQLVEHMSHLLALREREPAPMAVLALRIEGLATAEARLGESAARVLRRRLAVRLRAGVRASDVVASVSPDTFAVLLGALLAPEDAQRVGAKLLEALFKPVQVAGEDLAVAVALGVSQYPQDGTQPEALLRRAIGLSASAQALGRAGFSNFVETSGRAPAAANDDDVTP